MNIASGSGEILDTRPTAAYAGLLFGAELEYMTVDRETLEPRDYLDVVSAHPRFGTHVKPELVRHQVELVSRPHASLLGLRDELRQTLMEVGALVESAGGCLLPVSVLDWVLPRRSRRKRYRVLTAALGADFIHNASFIASDQINVGAPDEASAFRIFRALVDTIPVFICFGAASPFRNRVVNGESSNRLAYYDMAFTRHPELGGSPPPLADLDAYFRLLAGLPVLNRPDTYYGYVRPMPQRGVAAEIRCLDKQPTLREALAFFALAKAVACHAMEDGSPLLCWPWAGQPPAPGFAGGFTDALRFSRNGGLPHAGDCRTVMIGLSEYLPEDERGLLDPLLERVSDGPPAARMVDLALSHGMEHLHRSLIHNLREEYATYH